MSLTAVTTDRRSGDTTPETPRLLIEGIATIDSFSAVTGGYEGFDSIDITQVNDIGNTNKNYPSPATYKIEAYHYYADGTEFDYFRPLPYIEFSNYSTGAVARRITASIINQHTLIPELYLSTIEFAYFTDSISSGVKDSAFYNQYIAYKVFSVPFAVAS